MNRLELMTFASEQKKALSVKKKDTIEARTNCKDSLLDNSNNENIKVFKDYNVVYGLDLISLEELLNSLIDNHLMDAFIKETLVKKYKQFEFKDWYLFRKFLGTGDYCICLCTGRKTDNRKVTFEDADTDYGLFGYVYNTESPMCSEAGSVHLIWVKDNYQGRLSYVC